MRYQTKIFNSRISKRIFTTFVVCAVVPVFCLAVLVYLQVTRHIREETYANLRHAAKSQAKILNDQLRFYEKEFELIEFLADKQGAPFVLPDHLIDRLSKTFTSISVLDSFGQPHAVIGNPPVDSLQLRAEDLRHMARGYTLLQEVKRAESTSILLFVRQINDTLGVPGHVVGQIDMDRFWETDVLDNLPLDTGFCVFGYTAKRLYPSNSKASELIDHIRTDMHSAISGHFEVQTEQGHFIASHTRLFLKPEFKLPHWDIVLFKSSADVFKPLEDLELIFPAVLLLALVVVLWLSLVNIRKNMVPIDALKTGVDRLASKEFSHRVDVSSGDELEDLADAFNLMSDQLRKKFAELNLIAGLGAHTTTILDVDDLTQAVIDSIEQNLDFSCAALLLMDSDARQVVVQKYFGFHHDAIEQMRNLNLNQGGMPQNPVSKAYVDQTPVLIDGSADTGDLNLFHDSGPQAVACIPLVYEGKSLGVLVLARDIDSDGDIQPSDTEVLTGIAAHTAVSLVNIDAFQKIRESEQRFRAAFDYSAGGILFIDPGGELIRCNSFFCSMLGYAKDELLSKNYRDILHSKDLAKSLASLERLLQGGPDADSFESRFLHKDGSDVWCFASTSLLRDASGAPLHYIILVQDLTAVKEAQREKQMLESQLQHAQKMEAVGTLAGGIAHDFNNILMGIYGYTQISLMKVQESGGNEITDYLDKIMTASERARELVKQILTFSRHGKPEVKSIDISPVVKETIKLLRATIPPNIEIEQHLPASAPTIMADPNQIHQVVMNLCTNAYHAVMEKDTGSIRVNMVIENSLPDELVTGDENESGLFKSVSSYLKLSIADNGFGMDPDTMGRIFDPYYTTKAEGKGTGLGLSVVHGIIKNHGGVITVESAPDEGTTFDIFLPISEAERTSVTESPAFLPTGSERVLVVDDEADIINIFEEMLSKLGYTVVCTNSPMDALNEFQEDPNIYDLVVTDMAMPKMMGSDLAKRMKALNPDVRIIRCSGYGELIDVNSNNDIFNGYLSKPFSYEKLATIVRQTLDQ